MVFQFFNLLPALTVRENVALPAALDRRPDEALWARVDELLTAVELKHKGDSRAALLSGGEMQRTAIARALINDPPLLLADEPTGNLDSGSGTAVLTLLRELAAERGTTLVLATHSQEAASIATRRLAMSDGRIVC
jgi:ABC-type lipoprotein export system ATPase subunit